MSARSARIQGLLAADASALRSELAGLSFDAVARLPLSMFVVRAELLDAIYLGLTRENAELVATRHVLPAITRLAALLEGRTETVRELISERGEAQVRAIATRRDGPRFGWLRGAIDADDVRRLISPLVQQMLQQFTARLPIPGLAGAGGAATGLGGGIGSLVGLLGKQVQRSAGQLADVGRNMLGGLIRDFSETATSDFRRALKERLASPEGQRIVEQMRERFVSHLLEVEVDDIVRDLVRLPPAVGAELVVTVIAHQREHPLLRTLLESELDAALQQLEARSCEELLRELGLYEQARAQAVRAIEAGVLALVESPAFEGWLERLLAASEQA